MAPLVCRVRHSSAPSPPQTGAEETVAHPPLPQVQQGQQVPPAHPARTGFCCLRPHQTLISRGSLHPTPACRM